MSTTFDEPRAADPIAQAPVLAPGHSPGTVTEAIAGLVTRKVAKTPKWWLLGFAVSFGLLNVLLFAVTKLFMTGIGVWGNNIPVGWAWDITSFVWWIGIGHAGTLISAILLLLRQSWRNSINRFAEAMTIFAVSCAGMYPILHLGRPWLPYWLLPIPGTLMAWPNFRSPLIWDVFAVSTYATISLVFWYVGMIPDLATLRDHSTSRVARLIYGSAALGWRGSARHWANYEAAALLLAGLSTPLVLSVHSIVSFDFSIGIVPGWHTTVFPPYFVAGAVFAGFAMVLTLVLPLRPLFGLKDFITDRHLQNMAKVMLTTGLIVAYGYGIEAFAAWYSGNPYEWYMMKNRVTGPYALQYGLLLLCNIVVPQLLWIKKVRSNVWALWTIAMVINLGMWLERFVIIVVSLSRDFVPSNWAMFHATRYDVMTFAGTIGLFLTLTFLFVRFLPTLNMYEMRSLTPEAASTPHEE